MFIITSKKYEFECPYSNTDFKKKFDRDIKSFTHRQLRKDCYLMDLFYGGRNDNIIEVHYHKYAKRDLDNPMFYGKICKGNDENSTKISGKFKRKTSNLISSLIIVLFWLFITVITFTQNRIAGLALLVITLAAVYIFFWDNNTPKEIKEYFSRYNTPPQSESKNTES